MNQKSKERKAFRDELDELQNDLTDVKRTMKKLPAQVQWNMETIKKLLKSYSSLEDQLEAKFAEYDSFIASQQAINESNTRRLDKLEATVNSEPNPSPARVEELQQKLHVIAESTPTGETMEAEEVAEQQSRIQEFKSHLEELSCSTEPKLKYTLGGTNPKSIVALCLQMAHEP